MPKNVSAFTQRLANEMVRYITAKEGGKPCWFYVRIHRSSQRLYESKLRTGSMNIRDMGDILLSGWGEEAPEKIRQFMTRKYNA